MIFSIFASLAFSAQTDAALVIQGVIDGDLPGGNPKAIVLTADSDIADLSMFGVGSANNGGGSDGEEFTMFGSATTGDVIVISGNTASDDFFMQQFVQDFTHFTTVDAGFTASINGDDAIELFMNGGVIDTYGDINVNGDDESWDYTDGYAVRTGGVAGAFDQSNYDSQFQFFDGQDEAFHRTNIASTFGLTAVPEPGSFALLGALSVAGLIRRRR